MDAPTSPDQSHDRTRSLADLHTLCEIKSTAEECEMLSRSELAWNMEVHSPLLKLALADHRFVDREAVNTAHIAAPFVPPLGDVNSGALVGSKMVDFAMVFTPNPNRFRSASRPQLADGDQDLAEAIRRVVVSQPANAQSVNQTLYAPLMFRPMAVSIETKVNGSPEEGKVQLGIWTSAWHCRMRSLISLVRSSAESQLWADRPEETIITLPLILVNEHHWSLSFACDRGDQLEVVGSVAIGDTSSLLGLYAIVAVLQELADWVEGPFRAWMRSVFGLA